MGQAESGAPLASAFTGEWAAHRSSESFGGRFISRGRLALRSAYWLVWLAVPRRAPVSTGVARELDALGLASIRLVAPSALLVGVIAVIQVAYQLAPWGAESVSPRAIAWFAARELGPVVVALLVVARSSAAIAGEFASMTTNGEIDALRAMGLDPVKYLVVPKLAALLISLPALTVVAVVLTMVGGWIGSTLFLGATTGFFLEQLREGFVLRDLGVGLGKSLIFAAIIGVISADEGLGVERRVAAIGGAATRAVVFALLGVLVADTVINAIFYFIPGLV